ncbi:MAG TPA: hypothetical protein VIG24_14900 [Acidimicrobiia bacterium]
MDEPQMTVELPTGGRYTGPRLKALRILKGSQILAASMAEKPTDEQLAAASAWMPR